MDPISNVISDKADELFQTPTVNDPVNNKEEEILNLESTDTEHNNEVPTEVGKDEILDLESEKVKSAEEILDEIRQEDVGEDKVHHKGIHKINCEARQGELRSKRGFPGGEGALGQKVESADVEHNNEVSTETGKDITTETKEGLSIDLLKLKKMIHSMKDQLDTLLRYVNGGQVSLQNTAELNSEVMETGERIVEGIFDGEKVIGPDEKEYSIPPNYASKSKLVEGDKMKLTITNNGRFIYKQISQIGRKRLTGELVSNEDQWSVLANGKIYKVLTASVTFYKGKPGDEVIFFVADDGSSSWGAVENIVHKNT